jgi:hypothetical protein
MGDNIYADSRRKFLSLSDIRETWQRSRKSALGMLDFVFKPADEASVRLELFHLTLPFTKVFCWLNMLTDDMLSVQGTLRATEGASWIREG